VLFLTGYIPEEKISEIRNAADILEVVSQAVRLKKTGKNHVGLCPFHTEKTPSFTVNPDKQIFHCFGCGSGGNVFTFLMKHDGISFPEAVRVLAGRYGVELPERRATPQQRRKMAEREQMLAANRAACDYYRRCLLQRTAGQTARNYLKKRGISSETIDRFQIGYAPKGWDSLLTELTGKGFSATLLEKCGLVLRRKSGSGHYDRFRERVVFPIMDLSTRVLGFGGRVLDDSLPKYLNSPETDLYNKSRTLYGLCQTKKHCRDAAAVFIVEGYFDLIALYQHGIRNTVATLGTALTSEHVRLLRGCIGSEGRATLVFDSDEAGVAAARRSVAVFDKGYLNAQILSLDAGYDPDTFVFERGADAFQSAADGARGAIPFLLDTAVGKHGLTIEGKVRIVSELIEPLATIGDEIKQSLYIREVAERLVIDEQAIRSRMQQARDRLPAAANSAPEESQRQHRDPVLTRSARIERHLVAMMLQVPAVLPDFDRNRVLDYFENDSLQALGATILKRYMENRSRVEFDTAEVDVSDRFASEVLDSVNDEHQRRLITELTAREETWSLEGCRKLIAHFAETGRSRSTARDISRKIKEAERNKDNRLLEKLLEEKQQLAVQRDRKRMALTEKP
jgi:DNA primase